MKKVTLFYVEYCASNIGNWTKEWFPTRAEAEDARKEKMQDFGTDGTGEMCGEYGDVCEVVSVEVPLTAAGLLHFANCQACGQD